MTSLSAGALQRGGMSRVLPAALHLDTGMTRLGLSRADVTRLSRAPELLAGVSVSYWLTHLACADDPDHPANAEQLARFADCENLLRSVSGGDVTTSVGNSALCLSRPALCGDVVRPGIALYGGNPFAGPDVSEQTSLACFADTASPPAPVAHWRAPILQLTDIAAGTAVGYGATHRTSSPTVIATVAAGYADGYRRSLSNVGWAVVHGQRVPLVGRVSMDLTTFDVTEVARSRALAPGDCVSLLGGGVDLDQLAAAAGTISYELLTGVAQRVPRDYCA